MIRTGLSLAEFRSNVSDLARPNRFEVQITPPSSFNEYYTDGQFNMLSWLAESAQIPSRVQGEISMKFHGMEYKLPGDYSKENLTIGFINSYGWEGRSFFDSWMEFIQYINDDNGRNSAYSLLSDSQIVINQLGRTKNDILASYIYYNVFPTNLSAIDLNMSENDSIEKFTVSFSYSHAVPYQVGV